MSRRIVAYSCFCMVMSKNEAYVNGFVMTNGKTFSTNSGNIVKLRKRDSSKLVVDAKKRLSALLSLTTKLLDIF